MKKFIKYLVAAAAGAVAAVIIMAVKDIFSQTELSDVYKILSDSFLVPGIIIVSVGLICVAANGGLFDMLGYGVSMLFNALRRDVRTRKYKDFYEYRQARKEKKLEIAYLLIVGALYIALAALFTVLWHTVV